MTKRKVVLLLLCLCFVLSGCLPTNSEPTDPNTGETYPYGIVPSERYRDYTVEREIVEATVIDTYYTGKTRGIYVEYNGVVGKWIDGGLWSKYGDKIGTTLHGVLETKTTRRGEFKKLLFCKELYWALDAEEPMIRRNAND